MSESTVVQVVNLVDSRWQTRQDGYSGPEFDELVKSVRQHGIINPPGVFVRENGEYELVYGHRRVAAAREAQLGGVSVTVLGDVSGEDGQTLLERFQQMVVADNLYHQDLSPVELAEALKALIEQQGLTQQNLAEIYGKSQQWVSDKIRLLDLVPDVQRWLTERVVEESVARKLAQLPPSYQPAVAKYVERRPTREATGLIQEIVAAADPAYWDLPEDKPWSPDQINVSAMMDGCLEAVPQEEMGKVLVALSKAYMLQRPALAGYWGLDRFAKACGLKGQHLEEWQIEHGRGCEQCLFAGEQLWRDCGEPGTKTCTHCLIAIDEVRLPFFPGLAKCDPCEKEGVGCTDLSCWIATMKEERKSFEEDRDEQQLQVDIEGQGRLRAFFDRQLQEDVDCEHWLARGCADCEQFRGPERSDQCGLERTRWINVTFWQSGEVIVPQCSGWRLRDPGSIPEIDQNCFDEILLGWLAAAGSKVAAFIPGKDGEERVAYLRGGHLNRKQLVALLGYAAHPDVTQTWIEKAELANPITGEKSLWTKVETAG